MTRTDPSTELAREVLAGLAEAGVREIVLAPGSRNAPLAFAAYDAAQAGVFRLHTRVDERSAGFLALGLTKVGSRAAVITTSGSAVANLAPSAAEAAHSGVPVVYLTADRPTVLRGTNANQTTDQLGLLGPLVPVVDVTSADDLADVAGTGPCHLNVPFAPPLVPADRWVPTLPDREERRRERPVPELLESGPRTVVVAGDDAGPPARLLAEKGRWPLLAEPTSGSRTGEVALRCYRLLLDGPLGADVERAVVLGRPTLSRPVQNLLGRADVEVVSVPPEGAWNERPFPVHRAGPGFEVAGPDDDGWLDRWLTADAEIGRALDRLLAAHTDLTPYDVAGIVSAAVPPEGLLFVGASNPIRDLDLMVARYQVGDRRKVIANRGLAGIDGVVSSAIGAALGRRSSRSLALIGDVTLLHDQGGLVLPHDDERPDLTIVVVNDDGGSIFATLEQGAPAYADRYDRLFGTPHGVEVGALCAATATPHRRVTRSDELAAALSDPAGGIEVVEAVVRRDDRRDLDLAIRALAGG
jgi:2-succinyl-5-enolpyruvyl-6-hydroxy-3-cyclohexene-1-carboxylate synthase